MSNTLNFASRYGGGGRLVDNATLTQQAAIIGATGGLIPALGLTLLNGTGSGQASNWYLAVRSVAGTTADNLDLAGGLTNGLGQVLTFTKVKYLLLAINSPDGAKKLDLGPKGASNPFIGPWAGGSGATVYDEVYEVYENRNTFSGWTVTATTGDILGIYNPGATTVTYTIFIIGLA